MQSQSQSLTHRERLELSQTETRAKAQTRTQSVIRVPRVLFRVLRLVGLRVCSVLSLLSDLSQMHDPRPRRERHSLRPRLSSRARVRRNLRHLHLKA